MCHRILTVLLKMSEVNFFFVFLNHVVPGASTGDPSHAERPGGQGKSGLEGQPQNQNLSVLLFHDFHQLL